VLLSIQTHILTDINTHTYTGLPLPFSATVAPGAREPGRLKQLVACTAPLVASALLLIPGLVVSLVRIVYHCVDLLRACSHRDADVHAVAGQHTAINGRPKSSGNTNGTPDGAGVSWSSTMAFAREDPNSFPPDVTSAIAPFYHLVNELLAFEDNSSRWRRLGLGGGQRGRPPRPEH
jgi:hypothetical protein